MPGQVAVVDVRAGVDEQVDALAGRELALLVLLRDSIGAVYFQLVDLLLERARAAGNLNETAPYLIEARRLSLPAAALPVALRAHLGVHRRDDLRSASTSRRRASSQRPYFTRLSS
mgnify:CR=1 FL=1